MPQANQGHPENRLAATEGQRVPLGAHPSNGILPPGGKRVVPRFSLATLLRRKICRVLTGRDDLG